MICEVIAIRDFPDRATGDKRKKGDIFEVSKERYLELSGNNPKKIKAIELIGIKKNG